MSQTTDEAALRQIAEGISKRDLSLLEAVSDPELEYTSRVTEVEGKTYYGPAGWSDYLADVAAALDDFQVAVSEFTHVGSGTFVASARVTALARESGVPIDQVVYTAWSLREGRAIWGHTYATREEALEAAVRRA
jgi:ketosteroid isomerase-like protein